MRKSDQLSLFVMAQCLLGIACGWHGVTTWRDAEQRLAGERALVQRLMLTDPALFTEARYTRHLSQADLHSAFQDFPLALEHFPAGSLVQPMPTRFRMDP